MLDPNDPADRRITAFTRSFPVSTFPNGDILQGWFSYDCWGDKQGGLYKERNTPADSKKNTGQRDYTTLRLRQMGCCPPQLMKKFLETESMAKGKLDPVEEAMKLHKRGYFGGGG